MILLLVVIAIASVVSLGWMAERYSSLLETARSTESDPVEAMIERFIEARVELQRFIVDEEVRFDPTAEGEAAARSGFAVMRQRALQRARMDPADYREMRARYQRWQEDRTALLSPWRELFERNAERLASIDLKELERLDR